MPSHNSNKASIIIPKLIAPSIIQRIRPFVIILWTIIEPTQANTYIRRLLDSTPPLQGGAGGEAAILTIWTIPCKCLGPNPPRRGAPVCASDGGCAIQNLTCLHPRVGVRFPNPWFPYPRSPSPSSPNPCHFQTGQAPSQTCSLCLKRRSQIACEPYK